MKSQLSKEESGISNVKQKLRKAGFAQKNQPERHRAAFGLIPARNTPLACKHHADFARRPDSQQTALFAVRFCVVVAQPLR
ncbi:MAG: hypothetical protein WC661_18925 [Opitutaceae bacterium]